MEGFGGMILGGELFGLCLVVELVGKVSEVGRRRSGRFA